MSKLKERRKHRRVEAQKNCLALNTINFGVVMNMSQSGLRIKYLMHPKDQFHDSYEISLLNNTGEYYIENLSCKVINYSDTDAICPPLNMFLREAGVMFTDLTPAQKDFLDNFVMHNSVPSA